MRLLVGVLVGAVLGCSLDPIVGGDCRPGLIACDGRCLDPKSDDLNCGGCGNACIQGGTCIAGACVGGGCEFPETWCDGAACADLSSDPENCGECGHRCGEGERCASGECVGDCPEGLLDCDGSCVDPGVDPSNCGDCGTACEPGQYCVDGECTGGCPDGLVACGRMCVDTTSDPANCGGCGQACDDASACLEGICVPCDLDEVRCDGECVELDSDPDHCGGCATSCEALEECQGGICVLPCPPELHDCRTGACVDFQTDPDHCGSCETVCAPDESCQAGACVDQCGEGLTACNRQCVDVTTDPDNCGGCSVVCDTGICEDGRCRAGAIGHLVAIGHDYASTRRDQSRIVGNAVLIAQGTLEVLTYGQYADADAARNAVDAVASTAADASRQVTFTELEDPQLLEADLVNYDVLLLFAQISAEADTLEALGELWSTALAAFLARGGVVVFVDWYEVEDLGGTYRILDAAGLLAVDGLADATGDELLVVGAGDAVATGMSASYRAERHTARFVSEETNVVVANDEGPVVIHKVFLP